MRVIKIQQIKKANIDKKAIAFDAINLHSFEDRNRLNKKIREFKEMAQTFGYLRKYIYQNAPHAQKVVGEFIEDKKMSSYPELIEWLKKAYKKSRDNYDEFAAICDTILEKIYQEIESMEQIRKDFSSRILQKRMKERTKISE